MIFYRRNLTLLQYDLDISEHPILYQRTDHISVDARGIAALIRRSHVVQRNLLHPNFKYEQLI